MKRYNYFKYVKFVPVLLTVSLFLCLFTGNCKRGEKIPQLSGDIDYNLLLITIDTLRADRLGCYGFSGAETPVIDKLADTGVLFKHCFSPTPITLPAYCSMFTGKTPPAHGVRNNSTYFLPGDELTLAEVLSDHGFQTHAVVSLPALMGKFGLNQGYQVYDDSLDFKGGAGLSQAQLPAETIYARFKGWFTRNRESGERFYSWVHFSDPHAPYTPGEEYGTRFARDPYSGEVAAVDFYIGKMVQDLAAQQLLDKTLIIITSGHGEAFGEHQEFGHGILCYNESLEVPLIFSNPVLFKKGVVVNRRVSVLDIMPTVLHLFGVENPAAAQGIRGGQGESIAHLLKGEQDKDKTEPAPPFYFESMLGKEEMNLVPVTGIMIEGYKYIDLPEAELYDMDRDPLEKENIVKQDVGLTERVAGQFREYAREYAAANGKQASSLPAGIAALDPKQGISLVNKLIQVKKQIAGKALDEAEKSLEQIQAEYRGLSSDSPYIYENRHDLLRGRGDLKGAEEVLKKGISLFPGVRMLRIKLATFYVETGQAGQAHDVCRELLSGNPRDTEAGIILRRVFKEEGKVDDQVTGYYEEALKEEPLNAALRVEYAEILQARGKNDAVLSIVSALMENDLLMNDSASLDIKTNMGMLLLRMGQFDRTITLCLYMASQGNKNPQVLNQLGKAYSGKGDLDNALDAYNKALALDEKNALTLSNLGTLYLTMLRAKRDPNLLPRAIEYYSRSLEANPRMLPALNGLAVAYNFAGEPARAIEYWQKAIEIDPGFSDVYFNLGLTHLRLGKKKEALKIFKLLKDRLYGRLSPREQQQLDSLIKEAGG